jgi:hypothetical protein
LDLFHEGQRRTGAANPKSSLSFLARDKSGRVLIRELKLNMHASAAPYGRHLLDSPKPNQDRSAGFLIT